MWTFPEYEPQALNPAGPDLSPLGHPYDRTLYPSTSPRSGEQSAKTERDEVLMLVSLKPCTVLCLKLPSCMKGLQKVQGKCVLWKKRNVKRH